MAKHRYDIDEARIAKWLKEGRGKGRGLTYKPWLRVQDLSSRGRSSRIPGTTTGRVHELMSDLERAVFLEFDHMVEVVDIREQFPLSRATTMRIATKAGIRHPAVKGVDIVMSTDLLVDVLTDHGRMMLAVSVKYASDLESARVVEKLEIERRFWAEKKVRWTLVTELDLNSDRTAVALWKHSWGNFDHLDAPSPTYWQDRCEAMLAALAASPDARLLDVIRSLESDGQFASGDGMTVIRHLLAAGALELHGDGGFDPRGLANQLVAPVTRSDVDAERDAA